MPGRDTLPFLSVCLFSLGRLFKAPCFDNLSLLSVFMFRTKLEGMHFMSQDYYGGKEVSVSRRCCLGRETNDGCNFM